MKREILLESLREFLSQNGVYDLVDVVKEVVENEADPSLEDDASEGMLCYYVNSQLDGVLDDLESMKERA